jgi:hypothetical protein
VLVVNFLNKNQVVNILSFTILLSKQKIGVGKNGIGQTLISFKDN